MKRPDRIDQLITPSLLSASVTIGITLSSLIVTALALASKSGDLYDWLLGPGSSATQIEQAASSISAINQSILGNTTLNKTLFFVMWMLIGLAVYIISAALLKEFSAIKELGEEMHYVNKNTKKLGLYHFKRFCLRLFIAGTWGLYWIFFAELLVPFSILCCRIGIGMLPAPASWLYVLASLFVLTLSLHLHVIFMRLLALRPRLTNWA